MYFITEKLWTRISQNISLFKGVEEYVCLLTGKIYCTYCNPKKTETVPPIIRLCYILMVPIGNVHNVHFHETFQTDNGLVYRLIIQ